MRFARTASATAMRRIVALQSLARPRKGWPESSAVPKYTRLSMTSKETRLAGRVSCSWAALPYPPCATFGLVIANVVSHYSRDCSGALQWRTPVAHPPLPQSARGHYAGAIVLFIVVGFFFVPDTKGLSTGQISDLCASRGSVWRSLPGDMPENGAIFLAWSVAWSIKPVQVRA